MRASLAEASELIRYVYAIAREQDSLSRAGEALSADRLMWGLGWETTMYLDRARRSLRLAERALALQEDPRNTSAVPIPEKIIERKKGQPVSTSGLRGRTRLPMSGRQHPTRDNR
jgi:hypothetical protein